MNFQRVLVPNGTLPLSLGWKGAWASYEVTGGPYDAYENQAGTFGVCVRAERVPAGVDVLLPIKDFGVPANDADVLYALGATYSALERGLPVYVGCAGGFGRTGLFLALMAKVAGVSDPVAYVRKTYCDRAVETKAQEEYVAKLDVSVLRKKVLKAAWKRRLRLA